MHARAVLSFWITLLAMSALVISSPVPEPEPVPEPYDSTLGAVISSNLNMGCLHGCGPAYSAQQLNKNAALGSAASPLSVFAAIVLAGGVLASI